MRQDVLSVIRQEGQSAHPVHLHGHSFHVAGIFYAKGYDHTQRNDSVSTNSDITCLNNPRCTDPNWTTHGPSVSITEWTIRKDTVIVPPGGYVVIRFLADNPGYWFMHCHIEPHLIDGMAVVINEHYDLQNPPPTELGQLQCGNFNWNEEEFDEKLNFNPKPCKAAGFNECYREVGKACYIPESNCWFIHCCYSSNSCCPDISDICPLSEPDQCLVCR